MFHPVQVGKRTRYSYARIKEIMEMPNLLDVQRKSYEWFRDEGLAEIFRDISPITDFSGNLELFFGDFSFGECKYSLQECKRRDGTYAAPLRVKVKLYNKAKGDVKEQDVFFGDFPIMTETGTFICNGAERVIVSQLVRSPGAYYERGTDSNGKLIFNATVIPNRGAWIELETDANCAIWVRIDRTRKMPVTYFLRALGFETNEQILDLFGVDDFVRSKEGLRFDDEDRLAAYKKFFGETDGEDRLFKTYKALVDMLDSERAGGEDNREKALIGIYNRLRPGEPPSAENAAALLHSQFFDSRRYDLAGVGRFKITQKLGWRTRLIGKILAEDIVDARTGEILIPADGHPITKEQLDKITDEIPMLIGWHRALVGKVCTENIRHPITKQIVINADEVITDELLESIDEQFFDDICSLAVKKLRRGLESPIAIKIKTDSGIETILATFECGGRLLSIADIVSAISYIFALNSGHGLCDDIDHLGNRRVRAVGELLLNQFRIGMSRMERVVKERMTTQDVEIVTPQNLINIRPVVAAIKEFFGSSQLSQFMDQHNPLSELTHKRRLSALGPGGLSRERAGFEVRDVHNSHYGRMCPIETPEGPNIGLIGSLSNYARVNRFGFIETPYRRVIDDRVTDQIVYMRADEEEEFVIAQANEPLDQNDCFVHNRVTARFRQHTTKVNASDVDFMDVSPKQVVSIATALIPFLENDDANRALMGANMQRQAVPLLKTQAPLVGTGMEYKVARDSGVMIAATHDGTARYVDANKIVIDLDDGEGVRVDTYNLQKFIRSNQSTCINQIPIVKEGDSVKRGQIIADGPATDNAELALGYNIIVAYMPWEGYNYEDAILLNENLIKRDIFTSIHIEEYQCDARDTKLGPEEVTRDIPNVADDALSHLDSDGIIAIGSDVRTGDILVGKVTPKGETELSAEERLLRAIFGEKAREVRDSSLRVPHGESGKVVAVNVFTRDQQDELAPGVNKEVRVYIAQKRKISVGDKMSGRHGNKGVVSEIRRQEDMPFLPDGTPVDIVLNPLGVPSRMNIGQILETHLGMAARLLAAKSAIANADSTDFGLLLATPVFDGARQEDLQMTMKLAGMDEDGKTVLYDGRTGLPFDNRVTVGCVYMLKLHHLVDDKIHARSTGPYSLVTQQPLGGKAQFGGQRFGEMEVWALEAYGAAYTLQEILTVKSDDVVGRVKAYESIVKGQNIPTPGVPESFKVLIRELQSIALDIRVLNRAQNQISIYDDDNVDAADVNLFDSMRIGLASPQMIRQWSHGEVKKPETINYRTLKPERDGLFCERIFGPVRDWECHCGKYKRVRYKGTVCDRCGVEVTRAKVRRERMGHIELAAPVSHIWYFKGIPSRMGLLLDMSPRALERVLYFAAYIVLDSDSPNLKPFDLVTEGQLRSARLNGFTINAAMGAEAIASLLANLDLDSLADQLKKQLHDGNGQKRLRAIRRLDVVESLRKSDNRPEWMILTALPVIPPDLRPMVQLDGGRFATSDLNDLYRRVINRNNRLARLLRLNAPDIIIRNEKRMLQEAVDALIDNGRRGRPVTGPGNRPLKSLSDMLKGKQGRFRQNLLGKRVDYSGRSVIVVGPELKLHQCGLPKEMALELFKPFVMKKLAADGAMTIKAAKKRVEREDSQVWAVLEDVIKEHPVLLNRAPTLHRLGIQAFEPVLTEGRALKLHPLACTAYNADFDGDQMAIHLPLSAEAQAEARVLMLAANHILAPKDGKPIIVPTQDMVLGTYFLTKLRPGSTGSGRLFSNHIEVLLAYENGRLHLQAPIKVRLDGRLVQTSVGRLIFNLHLPEPLRNHSTLMNKKALGKLVSDCYKRYGATRTAEVIDKVKRLGYHYACTSGMTVAISDVIVPPAKKAILANTSAAVKKVESNYQRGLITQDERYNKVISLWSKATDEVADAMMANMDEFNPIYMMSDSGARGNKQQMRQLAGMRGLMADPSGKIIDLPITANFREGLSVNDYFISSHGARKGLADTALRTADSGYLTRRLVDVAQDVIVRQVDCDERRVNIQYYRAMLADDTFDALELLREQLIGKVLAQNVEHNDAVVVSKDTVLDDETLVKLGEISATSITLRGNTITGNYPQQYETIKLGTQNPTEKKRLLNDLAKMLGSDPLPILRDEKIVEMYVHSNTVRGIEVESISESNSLQMIMTTDSTTPAEGTLIEPLIDRIVGRTLAEDLFDNKGEIALQAGATIDQLTAEKIIKTLNEHKSLPIANPLTIERTIGTVTCAAIERTQPKPGRRLLQRLLVDDKILEVGTIIDDELAHKITGQVTVQALNDDGTLKVDRLTGTAGTIAKSLVGRVLDDSFDDSFKAPKLVTAELAEQIRDELFEKWKTEPATVPESITGDVAYIKENAIGHPLTANVYDKHGNLVAKAGTVIDNKLADKLFDDLLPSFNRVSIRSVLTCKAPQGVCIKCYGQDLANDTQVEIGEAVGIIAAQSIGEPGTQLTMRTFHTGGVAGGDITQGLPRVEELFEARKPKMCALIAEITGVVSFTTSEKNQRQITITPLDPNYPPRNYTIPYGSRLLVAAGQLVHPGTELTDGPKNPHDILRICGLKETYRYLVKEVQKVYKSQGVEINDKHIEVMVRQMLHKVKIEESGATDFLPGEFIDINVFESANTRAIEEGLEPAVAKPILLGITKASLATDSFLSAASFQETTRVLTDAAIKGKVDPLVGLKENVIIGKLIPAGTGMARYRKLTVIDKEAEAEAEANADAETNIDTETDIDTETENTAEE